MGDYSEMKNLRKGYAKEKRSGSTDLDDCLSISTNKTTRKQYIKKVALKKKNLKNAKKFMIGDWRGKGDGEETQKFRVMSARGGWGRLESVKRRMHSIIL